MIGHPVSCKLLQNNLMDCKELLSLYTPPYELIHQITQFYALASRIRRKILFLMQLKESSRKDIKALLFKILTFIELFYKKY